MSEALNFLVVAATIAAVATTAMFKSENESLKQQLTLNQTRATACESEFKSFKDGALFRSGLK